jgi:hypothetical protein
MALHNLLMCDADALTHGADAAGAASESFVGHSFVGGYIFFMWSDASNFHHLRRRVRFDRGSLEAIAFGALSEGLRWRSTGAR